MEGYESYQFPGQPPAPDGIPWANVEDEPMTFLLNVPDTDGTIRWRDAEVLAHRIEEVIPRIEEINKPYPRPWRESATMFVVGLRKAAAAKQDVKID